MLKYFLLFFPFLTLAAEPRFVSGCRILSLDGVIEMTFPGKSCSFMDDGRVLSLTPTHIRMFENTGKVDWEMKLPTPDTNYTLSSDRKRILLSSLKPGDLPGDPLNFLLNVMDLNGYRIRTTDSMTLFGMEKALRITDFREATSGYLISLYGDGVYFLDEKLKLTKKKLVLGKKNEVDNVHFTPEGNIYYFVRPDLKEFSPAPVVYMEEFDLRKNRLVLRWPSQRSPGFYFVNGGSVKLSGDLYVVNHPLSGSYLISRKTGELSDFVVGTHFSINQIRVPEEVILSDLGQFLAKWRFW